MIREVKLYGNLAEKYGKTHRLDADSPYLLISGLSCMLPGFYNDFMDGKWQMIGENNRVLSVQEMTMALSKDEDIKILPNADGAFTAAAIGLAGGLSLKAIATNIIINLLITVALGALSRLLAPSPKVNADNIESPGNERRSFIFNGSVNVTAQGGAVPLVFGRTQVGSTVISAGISAETI